MLKESKNKNIFGLVNVPLRKPTSRHRPAIWENMLGTVNSMNSEGRVKYFDYKYKEAKRWADIDNDSDIRAWKFNESLYPYRVGDKGDKIRKNQMVVWVKK